MQAVYKGKIDLQVPLQPHLNNAELADFKHDLSFAAFGDDSGI